ncbi:MAG: NADH-quinone oxidoreductase subunit NuoH [Terriglobia bacterium]
MLETILVALLYSVGLLVLVLANVIVIGYVEMKVAADMQVRLGPMRVGWHGILQPVADGLKMFLKEDTVPRNADKPLFWLAPIISFVPGFLLFLVIPLGETLVANDMDIGIFYIFALATIMPVGVVVAGWASNSKYSLLGGLRGAAQQISYEVPLLLSLLGVVMIVGSLSLVEIVGAQSGRILGFLPGWFIFLQPFAFLLFFVSLLAEVNRVPFDIPEAESEIVAGYFTEYSGMKFGLFFATEYMMTFLLALLGALVFLGGWRGPFLPPVVWLLVKTYGLIYVSIWVRWSLPRVRIDQILALGWKILLPATLLNIFVTGLFLLQ